MGRSGLAISRRTSCSQPQLQTVQGVACVERHQCLWIRHPTVAPSCASPDGATVSRSSSSRDQRDDRAVSRDRKHTRKQQAATALFPFPPGKPSRNVSVISRLVRTRRFGKTCRIAFSAFSYFVVVVPARRHPFDPSMASSFPAREFLDPMALLSGAVSRPDSDPRRLFLGNVRPGCSSLRRIPGLAANSTPAGFLRPLWNFPQPHEVVPQSTSRLEHRHSLGRSNRPIRRNKGITSIIRGKNTNQ